MKKTVFCNLPLCGAFFLRAGLATVFLYAAIAATLDPTSWVGFFPEFVKTFISPIVLLYFFSAYQVILSLWLLSGKKTRYAAWLAATTLLTIILPNIWYLDIIFRDVAILFSAIALALMSPCQEK